MIRTLATAVFLLVTAPALAQGQSGGAAAKAPKPTKADVQKVVKIISDDKAKTKLYCALAALNEEVLAAEEKKDTKKVEELSRRIETTEEKLGVEFVNLMEGLDQIDPESEESEAIFQALDPLDELCFKE